MKKFLVYLTIGAIIFAGSKKILINSEESKELMLENIEALSNGTEDSNSEYIREDGICTYKITGKAGTEVSIYLAGVRIATIKVGADGTATYSYEGKTNCTAGGKQMCTPRYCPQLSFL